MTNGFNNLIKLFKIFNTIIKQNTDFPLSVKHFFNLLLNMDISIMKTLYLTDEEKNMFQNKLDNLSINIKQNSKKREIVVNLYDYKVYKSFSLKSHSIEYLFTHNLISDEEKTNLIKHCITDTLFNFRDTYIYTRLDDKDCSIHAIYFGFDKDYLKIFHTYPHFLEQDFIISTMNFINDSNIDKESSIFTDYFVCLWKKIVDQKNIGKHFIVELYDKNNREKNKIVPAYIGSFDINERRKNKKSLMPYYAIRIYFDNNRFTVSSFINELSSLFNGEFEESYNKFLSEKYTRFSTDIEFTYIDLLNFIKYLIFINHSRQL